MNDVEIFEKFHTDLFGKKASILWSELKKDPTEGFKSAMHISQIPQLQTMETGFLLGVTLAYAMQNDPLRFNQLLATLSVKGPTHARPI